MGVGDPVRPVTERLPWLRYQYDEVVVQGRVVRERTELAFELLLDVVQADHVELWPLVPVAKSLGIPDVLVVRELLWRANRRVAIGVSLIAVAAGPASDRSGGVDIVDTD